MVDHTVTELRSNGAGLQAYLKKTFVHDSAFPSVLSDGAEVVAHPTPGGGLLLQPVDRLDAYPLTIEGPPEGFREQTLPVEDALADVDADALSTGTERDTEAEEVSD